ncbi:17426_t:CDS:2 [Racocetra persica]|uniref:17426_t:CDS:1 n=1 Tax=Racocetra persica TaxID=160502 RepID=A0ACA9KBH3_9GLOM|nr:17426_t:CDS:2 [Racocetra persica]
MASCGRSHRSIRTQRRSTNTELVDTDQVEYLPPVATDGLLCKVRAAIYLSLDELWAVPTNIALVATFLDLRFKHFNWTTSVERSRAQNLVKTLYNELKTNLTIPDDNDENLVDRNYNDDDGDFFHELEANSTQADVEEDDNEIMYYVKLKEIKINDDPLEWWLKNRIVDHPFNPFKYADLFNLWTS